MVIMPPNTLHIHYCHGLESGPDGYKARWMRTWATVTAPDQQMSLWNPLRSNSVARSLLYRPGAGLSRAVLSSLEACVQVQLRVLADSRPDVLVGSSWGGLVAAVLIAEGAWQGPAVLLCPALRLMERRLPALHSGPRSAERLTEALAMLPEDTRSHILLIHGTADPTIPISDSRALARDAGVRLREIEGGSHGLGVIARDGRLRECIEQVASH